MYRPPLLSLWEPPSHLDTRSHPAPSVANDSSHRYATDPNDRWLDVHHRPWSASHPCVSLLASLTWSLRSRLRLQCVSLQHQPRAAPNFRVQYSRRRGATPGSGLPARYMPFDAMYTRYPTPLHETLDSHPVSAIVRSGISPAPDSSRDSVASSHYSASSRHPEVVSIHGGCVVPSQRHDTEDTTSMVAYNTLQPPPTRLGSMASITSFTMDSARALSTIHDLAAQRLSLARSRMTPASPLSSGSASVSALETLSSTAEMASRLLSVPHAKPDAAARAQHALSPLSERSTSGARTPRETSVASSVPRSRTPSSSPVAMDVPLREPSPQMLPLTYVVTTPAHVLASIPSPSAPLTASMFNANPYGEARQGRPRLKFRPCKRYNSEVATDPQQEQEQPPQKKPRLSPLPSVPPLPPWKPLPAPAPQVKVEPRETTLTDPDSIRYLDNRPPKESVGQLAVGSGRKYSLSRIRCLWPGCLVNDYAGELWHHIRATHRRNAGRPKPSGNPVLNCNWAPPGEPRGDRCTYRDRASKMWDHFIAVHHKESVSKETGEIVCRLGQCTARSKNLDFQRHLEDVHWKLEGTVRWCEGCGVWKRFDKGRLLKHFETCVRKFMENDPGFRQGLLEL
ncbi:uncharacterized protein B0H18DRAFT_1056049 [Fomitopsis serialis]|uniref:uncharacterized protein n=1 Tax=Fomitopsis serialis TaxID=139415 RepID=UPI0020082FF1|nr:uncharacterized protein B0H18DRAFT_1056049 [Neoantrodia serialis]KAH9912123.1 hypothetical protein B0H18DRAFT_1056049 [Neoantrodia serialis]